MRDGRFQFFHGGVDENLELFPTFPKIIEFNLQVK
jgi:hypothetical protein